MEFTAKGSIEVQHADFLTDFHLYLIAFRRIN